MSLRRSSHENYERSADEIKAQGARQIVGGYQRIVFTNGCFDLIHPGHLQTFAHCRMLAGAFGAVVVGLNDDASVWRIKGDGRPILPADARGEILMDLRDVDYVVTFEEDTPIELIRALRPDIIVKGGDYDPIDVIGRDVSEVSICEYLGGWSSSEIIRRAKLA